MRRQPTIVLTVLLSIAYLDQLAKAWAWRHLGDVHVNSGGDILLGRTRVRVAAAGGVLSTCVLAVIGAVGYAGVSQPVAALAAQR